jgi:hypothetical protein
MRFAGGLIGALAIIDHFASDCADDRQFNNSDIQGYVDQMNQEWTSY